MPAAASDTAPGSPSASRNAPTHDEPGPELRALAARLAEGVAVCRDDRIVWASPRLAAMAGVASPCALVGRRPSDLLGDAGDGLPMARESVGPARRCRLRRPGAADRSVTVQAASGVGGEEIWVFGDLTPAEQRDELLTVVSHELRTPITVITGYSRLLLSEQVGPLNDEQRRFLEECTKSCQRLNDFIGNLLSASREAHGQEVVDPSDDDLVGRIRDVLGFLRPLADEKGLALELDSSPGTCSKARFDPLRIEQVLTNLIGNAIRYADARIAVSVAHRAADGEDFVVVCVADDGPGIPEAERDRIFEPYVRGEAERSGGPGGLGLGLAISRRIVEAHGGSIRVVEQPGGGSRFEFTLPVVQGAGSRGAAR